MAKGLSWGAILLATLTMVLVLRLGFAEPPSSELAITLNELMATVSLLAGFLAPLVAVAGLLLAKRGGKRAPRLARVALAVSIGALSWPLLLFVPLFICPGGLC
jgi:hypothetical protein